MNLARNCSFFPSGPRRIRQSTSLPISSNGSGPEVTGRVAMIDEVRWTVGGKTGLFARTVGAVENDGVVQNVETILTGSKDGHRVRMTSARRARVEADPRVEACARNGHQCRSWS